MKRPKEQLTVVSSTSPYPDGFPGAVNEKGGTAVAVVGVGNSLNRFGVRVGAVVVDVLRLNREPEVSPNSPVPTAGFEVGPLLVNAVVPTPPNKDPLVPPILPPNRELVGTATEGATPEPPNTEEPEPPVVLNKEDEPEVAAVPPPKTEADPPDVGKLLYRPPPPAHLSY